MSLKGLSGPGQGPSKESLGPSLGPSIISKKDKSNIKANLTTNKLNILDKNILSPDPLIPLKLKFKELLNKHFGNTLHPEVIEAINDLAELNPTPHAAQSSLNIGNWVITSAPTFPGRVIPQPGHESQYQFTLGRMSFDLFEPSGLVCTVNSIINQVDIKLDQQNNIIDRKDYMSQSFISNITIHTSGGDLEGITEVEGMIWPDRDNRLSVVLNGGSLMAAPSVINNVELMQLWKDTFSLAYTNADQKRDVFSRVKRQAIHSFLKLTPPSDKDADIQQDYRFSYTIDNSPHGQLDIMQLDEDLRISKGNRGTQTVNEKNI